MTPTIAERCVFVDLYGREGEKLFPLLDEFAEDNTLVPDKSHPVSLEYRKFDETGTVTEQLSYSIGMGEFGAALALFRFDQTQSVDLRNAFDRWVAVEIAARFKVTQCTEDQFPTMYR